MDLLRVFSGSKSFRLRLCSIFKSFNLIYSILNLLPGLTWRIPTTEKVLFLTFDDGPIPEVTTDVLERLSSYQAKATFFCIGENVSRHSAIFNRIVEQGHATGNHTYNHLNGWHTNTKDYLINISRCQDTMESAIRMEAKKKLFRPPYGKLKPAQLWALRNQYKLIMWNVLPRDWEKEKSANSCFEIIKRKTKPGSIIVFHDSIKAKERMLPALEMTLEHYSALGFRFESLEKFV